jgi:sugar phosphate isomerase/epimerase
MKRWCKLAILTDEVSQDLPSVLRFANDFALDGIELRSIEGKAFKDLTPEEIANIAQQCRDAGVAVCGCATPVFKCPVDSSEDIAAHTELFRRSLDAAHTLGAGIVRVFTFLRRETRTNADDIRRAAEAFPKLIEIARGSGVVIGVENEASCLIGSGTEMRDFLAHLPVDPQLRVVWDPCNVLYLEGTNDPVHDDFPLIADRVGHVHLKDARREGDRPADTCVELGTGQIDFAAQLSQLRSRGYDGWITLETHWRTVPLDSESQHLPAGHAFSANAEPASRVCMEHLKRFVAGA